MTEDRCTTSFILGLSDGSRGYENAQEHVSVTNQNEYNLGYIEGRKDYQESQLNKLLDQGINHESERNC